jgi:hypothetical protein
MDIARGLLGLIGERGRVLGGRIADILFCDLGVSDTRLGVQCFLQWCWGSVLLLP